MAQFNNNTTYILSGGLQDNGVKYRPAGTKDFRHMYGADGFCTAFQPNNPNRFYSSINATLRRINYVDGSTTSVNPPGASDFFKFVLTPC
ncbi:MAG: hypothetical protein IPN49_18730 [Saprospiraceae bacterium]|nr:hypothetical protein [Saprospiraceae bacterium]